MNNPRTYRDLLQRKASSYSGNCCACHAYAVEVRRLSTRANICTPCIERKGEQVLGSVLKAERRVARWIKEGRGSHDDKWVSTLAGVPVERVVQIRAAIQAKAGA